jgi:hypothetical protein
VPDFQNGNKDSSSFADNIDEFDCNVSPDNDHNSRQICISRQPKTVVSFPSINSTPVLLENLKQHSKSLVTYLQGKSTLAFNRHHNEDNEPLRIQSNDSDNILRGKISDQKKSKPLKK